ncbi:ketopantoate reductase family protein [Desulfococcus sp.]|uniref:ketopantoate reductase family protein n=1 Tax=Desulfococcus sp. TaxID=2025834 RepID=UPI003593991E
MRIVIIGAGAMGSIFGAMLSSTSDVVLVDPLERHIAAIAENGLTVEGAGGTREIFRLHGTTDPDTLAPDFDLAVVFTKSPDTRDAVAEAKSLLKPAGMALTLQNGLGNLDEIVRVLGPARALVGVTSHGGTMIGPGHVRHAGKGPTFIAGASPETRGVAEVVAAFRDAGIDTARTEDPDTLIWGKLVINVGINSLAAILRVPNGVLAATPACEILMAQAVAEAVAVAERLKIALPYGDPLAHVKEVCRKTAENRASMLQDILRGARTEVGVINGAIVDKGAALGVATPCNQFLSEMIAALEATADHRIE